MLKLAERLVRDKGVGAVCDFVQADVLDWRTDEQFDVTIAIGLWDYIADPAQRLRLIRKITLPGGVFLSTWPRFWTWRMPVRKIRLTMLGCPVYFFRRSEICGYLAAAGFQVETCEVVGKLYCVRAK
jgi:SAM-dependent methyltransferase